jgi:hypothetical protein
MPNSGVREITEPIELKLIDDRMHFTCISGDQRFTFSASPHKCRNAAMAAMYLLDKFEQRQTGTVLPFGKKGGH